MMDFSRQVLAWYDRYGRRDLPWHRGRDPYRIWVSEIMLQQTQVNTVIPYYGRFMQALPTIAALARASMDQVLHLWTGLGYYARARNLQQAARRIMDQHHGAFPSTMAEVRALPGIGPSTAGAILAFAFDQRHPILDGNVKRVLTRVHRLPGWPGNRSVELELWELADRHTPSTRVADYTQAIMDLGATVCRRRRPLCDACPVQRLCAAHAHGDMEAFPHPRPRSTKPVKSTHFVMIQAADRVLLERRPPAGVWGGLWAFPEVSDPALVTSAMAQRFGLTVEPQPAWPSFRHSFTHFHLDITPQPVRLRGRSQRVMENPALVWYNPKIPDARGLAAPVKRLLQQLR